MEDEEVITKDRANHPNCNYSISFNETCSDQNGEFVCESIKNFQRICPGAKPVTVYSKKQQFKGNSDSRDGMDDATKSFNFNSKSFGSENFNNMFGLAESFMNQFMSEFGNAKHPQFPSNIPPHVMESPGKSSSLWGKPSPAQKLPGRVVGPEEEI